MPLTDAACRGAKPREKAYKLTDASGLYLHVQPNGSRLWRFDYAFEGKRKTAALGKYPEVGLGPARLIREQMREALRQGRDPSRRKVLGITFGQVAREWFAANEKKWKTSYSARFWRRIEDDILPTLGPKELASIEPPAVLKLLREIEKREAIYTAKRICEMVSTIYRYAIAEGHTKFNPAADLKPALKPLPKREHRARLSEKELPEFFRRLRAYRGDDLTKLALELVLHTFVRTNEIRFGTWDEINGDVWTIPGSRMKMGVTHMVPLTPQSQRILAEMRTRARGGNWIFPGRDTLRKPASENAMLFALRNMGMGPGSDLHTTVHGFRGLASTALNESGLFHSDWIERQLAHVPFDKIRSAYNAAEWWSQRSAMMIHWSNRMDYWAEYDPDIIV